MAAPARRGTASGTDTGTDRGTPRASALEPLLRYLTRLEASGFYGRIQISFQSGRVTDVKIEQTRKLDEL